MSDDPNLQISTVQANPSDNDHPESDNESFTRINIKEEYDDLAREVFYFNSSEDPTFDDPDDDKTTIDLSSLLKMHMPDLKDDGGNNLIHPMKYKQDASGKSVKTWECGVCHKEFGHQYILMRHLPTHTDERKYQCKQCGKAFRQMSTLSQHRAIHSKLRPYVCEICQKTFNRVSTLISHRKTHTGLKPHRCHLCNKAFHQKGNLRNHIFTHTNERPYKCDVCNKGFNQMSNLMCHKFKAHQRADKPKYHCPTCGKMFDRRIGLRNHEQYEHGESGHAATLTSAAAAASGPGPAGAIAGRELTTPSVKYTNGVVVPCINTGAMKVAMAAGLVPFALLKPLDNTPVLVRVLPSAFADKQMLVPATSDDLKKYGKFIPKPEGGAGEADKENVDRDRNSSAAGAKELPAVMVSLPVVATVIQRRRKGILRMDILDPGPQSDVRPVADDEYDDYDDDDDDDDDENEGASSPDEKDYAGYDPYPSNPIMHHDPNMYEATSLMGLGAGVLPIDIDRASVEMFNNDEVNFDIANSMIDLEQDQKAQRMIASHQDIREKNETDGENDNDAIDHVLDDMLDPDDRMDSLEIDRIAEVSLGEECDDVDDRIEKLFQDEQ